MSLSWASNLRRTLFNSLRSASRSLSASASLGSSQSATPPAAKPPGSWSSEGLPLREPCEALAATTPLPPERGRVAEKHRMPPAPPGGPAMEQSLGEPVDSDDVAATAPGKGDSTGKRVPPLVEPPWCGRGCRAGATPGFCGPNGGTPTESKRDIWRSTSTIRSECFKTSAAALEGLALRCRCWCWPPCTPPGGCCTDSEPKPWETPRAERGRGRLPPGTACKYGEPFWHWPGDLAERGLTGRRNVVSPLAQALSSGGVGAMVVVGAVGGIGLSPPTASPTTPGREQLPTTDKAPPQGSPKRFRSSSETRRW
mmetsp:Transcript_37241/g.93441  ORF Transcript_37241/g.93441 Transcript_37241/m.93441 type:complete len:312 (+) Transcript_37241:712-1647(+)